MCTLVLVLPSWIIDGLLDVLNGSIICSESVYCPLSKHAKESISSAGGHLFASYINWEAWWKFDITWNCQFQLWVFMVYSSYPLSIVLKSFQGNYWLFYNQWYTSFVESFLFRQARWKNHSNATNLSKHLSMISNNLLVFMKHVLAIGRGLFFRLYNSNCIGRFASLLRTPGEIMYTCMYTCMYACIFIQLCMYTCIHYLEH